MVLIIISMIFFMSCSLMEPHVDELSFEREDYLGDEIKVDGFFHHLYVNPRDSSVLNDVIFFNRNGVAIHFSTEETVDEMELSFSNEKYSFENRGFWGIYQVEDSLITHETWKPESGFHRAGFKYAIHSDTVIVVSEVYGRIFGKKVGDVYNFRRFEPKPDSVTKFID